MAIAPIEDRLTSMMEQQAPSVPASVEPQDIALDQAPQPQEQQEGVQVAGLFGAEDVVRIVKQGTKGKDVLKQIADSNANQIELVREQAAAAQAAKKQAIATEKAKATRAVTKQETADVDALTGGALSAKTPEDRAAKLNTWLESNPPVDKVADVYKRLQKKDPASAALLEPRLSQELPTTTIPEGDVNVTKLEPMLPDTTVQPTDRPDLIPVIDSTKVKAFLSGEAPDDVPLDISFKNIKSAEDIDYVIRKTEEIFADEFYAAKRGKISDDELNSLATQMNMESELLKRQVGTVFNAEQLQAAKLVVSASGKKIMEMRQQIELLAKEGKNDDVLLLDFTNQLATHAALQMNFKAAKSEAGRALRASRVYTDDTGGIDVDLVNSMIADMGGANNIKNMATMMATLDEAQLAKFIQQGGSDVQKFSKVWKEVYVSALMSAPVTFTNMVFGGLFNSLMRPIDSAFAATTARAYDAAKEFVWSKKRVEIDDDFISSAEGAIELANFVSGMADAARVASKAFKNDAPIYGVGKNVDTQPDPAITSKLFSDPNSPIAQMTDFAGKVIRLPFRGALFADEGTKSLASNMELRKLAAREAALNIKNGMSSDDALMLMAYEITYPSAETLRKVDLAAKEAALQQDLGGFGNWVMSTRKKLDEIQVGGFQTPIPVGSVMAPFVKTAINAVDAIMTRTPIAPILKDVRTELEAGGARRQLALGKIHAGTAMMAGSFYLAGNTDGPVSITGLGPSDPRKRQFMKENEGWQACSLKVNGSYYSIAGFEPFAGLLCAGATIAENSYVYGKDDDAAFSDLMLYSALLPFKYVGELPMMDSMGRFFDMLQEVSRNPSSDYVTNAISKFSGGITQNMVGGVVPAPMPYSALLRQMERTLDPTRNDITPDPSLGVAERSLDFAFRNWAAGTPLMSKDLKPKRNFWGEEVTVGRWGKDEMRDDLSKTLRQLSDKRGKMIVNYPSQTIDNVRLNDNEYSDLLLSINQVTIGGKTMRQQIASDVSFFSSETKNGAFAGLANKLSETVTAYRNEALKSPAMMVYTDLQKNIANNKLKADLHVDMIKREPKE